MQKKMDRPAQAKVILIFERYEISAAAYHGDDLNGVLARWKMRFSKDVFKEIKEYLLSDQHHDRCSDEYIEHVCSTDSAIFATLDVITSNLRVNSEEVTEKNYQDLENAIIALADLWKAANLSHMPKLHSLLIHTFTDDFFWWHWRYFRR